MASFIRESKFRHIVQAPFKKENCYDQLKVSMHQTESDGLACNSKFIAYCDSSGSGSSIAVLPLSSTGKNHVPITAPTYQQPLIRAHSQPVTDVQFSPFNLQLLYSCSGDSSIRLWEIPKDGFTIDCTEPILTFGSKDVGGYRGLSPHHLVANLLAARGGRSIAIFDTISGQQLSVSPNGLYSADIQSMCWSFVGDSLATTSKDKRLRLLDFRLSGVEAIVSSDSAGHNGIRSSKCIWLGDSPLLASIGTSQLQERELFLWDSRNMSAHVHRTRIDASTSTPMMFFDSDTGLLIISGKGDASIRLYEPGGLESLTIHPVVNMPTGDVAKGMTLMPKQACDLMSCEILRLLKLTESSVNPVSIVVPRKEKLRFHEDLYPPTVWECQPSMDIAGWLSGLNVPLEKQRVVPPSVTAVGASEPQLALVDPEDTVTTVAVPQRISSSSRAKSFGSTLRLRNMYGAENPRSHTYFNLRPNTSNSDNPLIACSDMYWAIPYQGSGGGPIYVSTFSSYGKVEPNCPVLNEHKSPVNDIAFSPFHSGLLATAGSDCAIKLWRLPEDPACGDSRSEDSVLTLRSHRHTVRCVNFHPTVPYLLASTSQDMTVKLFDVNTGSDVSSVQIQASDAALPANLSFNLDGSLISVACKDKTVRVYDLRSQAMVMATPEDSSALGRNLRSVWCGSLASGNNGIITVSSAGSGLRTVHMWDPRVFSEPVCCRSIDNAPGQLFPMFDESSSVCFVAGKGDTLIRSFECTFLEDCSDSWGGCCERGTDFQTNSREPIAGICMMDKRSCDVMNVEVSKLLKLTVDSVVPLTFTVPRAESLKKYFQDDVFGPIRSRAPSTSIEEWHSNSGCDHLKPTLVSLKPADAVNLSEKPADAVVTPSSVRKRETIQKEEEEKKIRNETFAKVMSKAGGPKSFKVDAKLVDDDSDDNNWDDY